MKKIILLPIILQFSLYSSQIKPINGYIKQKMINGNTWRKSCPIKLKELRLIKISYIGFDNKEHLGEMIVHKSVANEVVNIFKELKQIKYPIEKIQLVSNYKGSDDLSMKNNNTSSFNCRLMTGSKTKYSTHSYGKAIDINPIQNPYVKKNVVLPKEGVNYIGANRVHLSNQADDIAIILKNDKIVKIFKKYGWMWGGDWKSLKDYQHFEKKYNPSTKNMQKRKTPKELFKNLNIQEKNGEFFKLNSF